MPVTEIERQELVNRLVTVIGEESTETLMNCLLADGRDQLASKEDLKALGDMLRAELASKEDLKALGDTLRAELASKEDLKALEAATKEDLKALENTMRSENQVEFAKLHGHIDSAMGKQMRIYVAMLVGVMLTVWGTVIVAAVT